MRVHLSIMLLINCAVTSPLFSFEVDEEMKAIKPCVALSGDNRNVTRASYHPIRTLSEWANAWARPTGQQDVKYKNFDNHYGQVSPDAASVIEKFVEAKGGLEALKNIKSTWMKGQVFASGEPAGEFEIYQAPKRHLSIHRFPDGSQSKHGTNGRIAWSIDVDGRPAILKGQEARDYIRHYESLHESLEWEHQFAAIFSAGTKKVRNESVCHLIFVAADNQQINRYFSVKSGLLIQEEQAVQNGTVRQLLVSEIRKYEKEISGTMVSRSRLNRFGSDHTVEYVVESLKTNSFHVDDKLFDIPTSVLNLRDSN